MYGAIETKEEFRLGGRWGELFLGGTVEEIKIYNSAKTAEEIAKNAKP